jgi:hypothetical protein
VVLTTIIISFERLFKSMPISKELLQEESEAISTKFFEAVSYFGLVGREIALLLGVSEATISRARQNPRYFKGSLPRQREIALLFIRLHRSVMQQFRNPRKGKHWLIYYSHELRACPIDLILTIEGLIAVVNFAEQRGRESKLSRFEKRIFQLGEARG